MKASMAVSSSCTLRWNPRLICFSASGANQRFDLAQPPGSAKKRWSA
jgi:hypothetical protein